MDFKRWLGRHTFHPICSFFTRSLTHLESQGAIKMSETITIKEIIDKHPMLMLHPNKATEINLDQKKLPTFALEI